MSWTLVRPVLSRLLVFPHCWRAIRTRLGRETADLITGRFYPRVKPGDTDADLTLVRGRQNRAAGQVVQLSGRVTNVEGEPLRSVPIEI